MACMRKMFLFIPLVLGIVVACNIETAQAQNPCYGPQNSDGTCTIGAPDYPGGGCYIDGPCTCDDLEGYTGPGTCGAGYCFCDPPPPPPPPACTSDTDCVDNFYCTIDSCNSGTCVHTARICDDGLGCTVGDFCDEALNDCVFPLKDCDDRLGCRLD